MSTSTSFSVFNFRANMSPYAGRENYKSECKSRIKLLDGADRRELFTALRKMEESKKNTTDITKKGQQLLKQVFLPSDTKLADKGGLADVSRFFNKLVNMFFGRAEFGSESLVNKGISAILEEKN